MKFLTDDEVKKVSAAVHNAEQQTSGEIVPMVVRRSSMVGHVPFQLYSLVVIFILFLRLALDGADLNWRLDLAAGVVGVLSVPLALWLSRSQHVQRWLIPKMDRDFEVLERAKLEFYESHIFQTQGQTGVLIFISLMEKQAVVLADKAISSKMPTETWQAVVDLIISGIQSGAPAAGLISAVEKCGHILAENFPIQPRDKNELPNDLIIKD